MLKSIKSVCLIISFTCVPCKRPGEGSLVCFVFPFFFFIHLCVKTAELLHQFTHFLWDWDGLQNLIIHMENKGYCVMSGKVQRPINALTFNIIVSLDAHTIILYDAKRELQWPSLKRTHQLDVLNIIPHGFLLRHVSQRSPCIPGNTESEFNTAESSKQRMTEAVQRNNMKWSHLTSFCLCLGLSVSVWSRSV